MGSWLLLLLILLPVALVIVISIMPLRLIRYVKFGPALASLINLLMLALMTHRVLNEGLLSFTIQFLKLTILIDKFSFLFAMLITISTVLISISSIPKLEEGVNLKIKAVNLIIFYIGAIYLCIAGDILSLVIAFLLINFSIFMALVKGNNIRTIEAGFKYLPLVITSTVVIIAGAILIYRTTGTSNLIDTARSLSDLPLKIQILPLVLILLGSAVQSGIFPFSTMISEVHFELPEIFFPLVPTIIITSQIYLIMRLTLMIFSIKVIFPYLVLFSILTVIFSETLALLAKDTKKTLIYSAYGAMGLILFAFSIPSTEAISSSFLILINTIFAITSLFLINGVFTNNDNHQTELKTAGYQWKVLIFFILISIFSIMGIPPFTGFFAKFSLLVSLLAEIQWKTTIFIIIFILQTVFQGIYLLRILGTYFKAKDTIDTTWYLIGSIITFGVIILALSVLSNTLTNFTKNSALDFMQGFKYLYIPFLPGATP